RSTFPSWSNSITGGAATQHLVRGGLKDAAFSSSVSVRGRWMTQIWSCASTATPAAWPMIQLLGSGLGHEASTWNFGPSPANAGAIVSNQAKRYGPIFMSISPAAGTHQRWRRPNALPPTGVNQGGVRHALREN